MSQTISNHLFFHAWSGRGTKFMAASGREAVNHFASPATAKYAVVVFRTVTGICLTVVIGHILMAAIANPHMADILQTSARLLAPVFVL
jgi:hypothetical protein